MDSWTMQRHGHCSKRASTSTAMHVDIVDSFLRAGVAAYDSALLLAAEFGNPEQLDMLVLLLEDDQLLDQVFLRPLLP